MRKEKEGLRALLAQGAAEAGNWCATFWLVKYGRTDFSSSHAAPYRFLPLTPLHHYPHAQESRGKRGGDSLDVLFISYDILAHSDNALH